jgi:hypothetical protein
MSTFFLFFYKKRWFIIPIYRNIGEKRRPGGGRAKPDPPMKTRSPILKKKEARGAAEPSVRGI